MDIKCTSYNNNFIQSSGVSQSLNRYHRFKGCLSTLKERSEEQLQSACEELAKITTNTQQQTRGINSDQSMGGADNCFYYRLTKAL